MAFTNESELLTASLEHLHDELLRRVAGKLFRARIGQPADELIEKMLATYGNPPAIDRCLAALPAEAKRLLAVVGRSRQPQWRVMDLLTLLASFQTPDAYPVLETLLHSGLVIAGTAETTHSFSTWFVENPAEKAIRIPEAVLQRAAALPLEIEAELSAVKIDAKNAVPLPVDGLEWPLRLAVAWQLTHALPVKMTQAGGFYKRDHSRFQSDPLLSTALSETAAALPDAGLFALQWAAAADVLTKHGDELHTAVLPQDVPLNDVLAKLLAGLFAVDKWDPLAGMVEDRGRTATLTAGLLALVLLAKQPNEHLSAAAIAQWLWIHHPHWSGFIAKEHVATQGEAWVSAYLLGVLTPLRIVEAVKADNGFAFRLGDVGRHLLAGEAAPPVAAAFPQTLLVQPNAEVLLYRQGLTPALIAKLSAFCQWKQIGAACTLELTSESVGRGMTVGTNLGAIIQTLDRHGMKPMPANVADLLRRWADKRERLSVYSSATLVEFGTAAELDAAIQRGIVTVRLTDRIGLTATGSDPDFANLRLAGNRDYEARPQQCVVAADDGVTLIVDAVASDLLLEAELVKFAEALPGGNGTRKFRMTRGTLRSAADHGMTLDDLNDWCLARSGEPMPAAAKLLFGSFDATPLSVESLFVLNTPTAEIADGLVQLPDTAPYIVRRIGPTAVVVEKEQMAQFEGVLRTIGLSLGELKL